MRWPIALLTMPLALATAAELEQPQPPPAYLPLRFNEDYSYLHDPTLRTDPFDAVKYLQLRAAIRRGFSRSAAKCASAPK
jgi:hypothetical protein